MKWNEKKKLSRPLYNAVYYKEPEVYNDIMHISENYSEALMSRHPRDAKTKKLELATCRNVKTQSLCKSEKNRVLWRWLLVLSSLLIRECLLGDLQLNTCIAQGNWQQHITEFNIVLTGETLWSSIHLLALVWTGTSPKFSSTSPSLVSFEVSFDPGTLAIRWGNLPDWVKSKV